MVGSRTVKTSKMIGFRCGICILESTCFCFRFIRFRLWHQLTLHLLECLKKPGFTASIDLNEVGELLNVLIYIVRSAVSQLYQVKVILITEHKPEI